MFRHLAIYLLIAMFGILAGCATTAPQDTLKIYPNGAYELNGQPVQLEKLGENLTSDELIIEADTRVEYQQVRKVLEQAHRAGVRTRLHVQPDPRAAK